MGNVSPYSEGIFKRKEKPLEVSHPRNYNTFGVKTMRKITLTMKEQNIYQMIKRLVENNGNKKKAAIRLGCTIRNVNLLIKKYQEKGKAGFSHGNKLRKPKRTISEVVKKKIIKLYQEKCYDYNWKHFSEKLNEIEGIEISYCPLHNILMQAGFISKLAFKRTRRKKTKELEEKKKLTEIDKKVIQEDLLLDKVDSHPRKPRAKYFGELIQMDASGMIWFDDVFSTLHLAVDDSTGTVVGAYFTPQETLLGYYNVLYQILTNYGIPNKFLTDNRTVFIYQHKNNPVVEDDTYTQFGYACKQLGIQMETSSIPQAKGRIERLNGTFQRRLPQELRTAKIHTLEQANQFLKSYLKEFNKRFALHHNSTTSVFEDKPSIDTINRTLAILSLRKFDSGSSIKYKGNYYIPVKGNENNIQCFRKGVDALVILTFDNKLYASVGEILYALKRIDRNKKVSEEFDDPTPPKPKSVYIPPMSHPYKHDSFVKYLQTIKHQQDKWADV